MEIFTKTLVKNLKKEKAVVPYINSTDSVKYKFKGNIYNLTREKVLNTQTPQAFRLKDIYELSKNNKNIYYLCSCSFLCCVIVLLFLPIVVLVCYFHDAEGTSWPGIEGELSMDNVCVSHVTPGPPPPGLT